MHPSPVKIILLTHQRELTRKDNTGKLILPLLGKRALVIPWERKNPARELINLIQEENIALLFPGAGALPPEDVKHIDRVIILDGTWQEGIKIYNRSPYLHALPRVVLSPATPSLYTLRRNQRPGGLCTAEAAALILKLTGEESLAKELDERLILFLSGKV